MPTTSASRDSAARFHWKARIMRAVAPAWVPARTRSALTGSAAVTSRRRLSSWTIRSMRVRRPGVPNSSCAVATSVTRRSSSARALAGSAGAARPPTPQRLRGGGGHERRPGTPHEIAGAGQRLPGPRLAPGLAPEIRTEVAIHEGIDAQDVKRPPAVAGQGDVPLDDRRHLPQPEIDAEATIELVGKARRAAD